MYWRRFENLINDELNFFTDMYRACPEGPKFPLALNFAGYPKEDIIGDYEGGVLTMRTKDNRVEYSYRVKLNPDDLHIKYDHGLLRVELTTPKAEENTKKEIPIL